MSKWEYEVLKVVTQHFANTGIDGDELRENLNSLGEQGWELTAAVPNSGSAGTTSAIMLVFKRPRGP
jgi:hypothetical protein